MRLAVCLFAGATAMVSAQSPPASVIYSHAEGEALTMERRMVAGPGFHPGVLLIGGSGDEDACCADWLARAGYAVFLLRYRAQSPYPAAVDDIQNALQFLRQHAAEWRVDSRRIAIVGIGLGGYFGNLAALRLTVPVQAVVSIAAWSDLRGAPHPGSLRSILDSLVEVLGVQAALAEASPVMHIRVEAPPFLLLHGDADRNVPVIQSTHWQNALQAAGISANLILIRGGSHSIASWNRMPGVRNWEDETLQWLRLVLTPEPGEQRKKPAGQLH